MLMPSARRGLPLAILATLVIGTAGIAHAVEPLPPPSRIETRSPGGLVTAVATPGSATRILDSASRRMLWNIPGWHRTIFVSDDGMHAVLGPEGRTMLPLDHRDGDPLLRFWRQARLVRTVTVGELVPKEMRKRTLTHYVWGDIEGIDADNQLVVRRIDGQVFRFELATGAQVGDGQPTQR